jgi:hypothetical protein
MQEQIESQRTEQAESIVLVSCTDFQHNPDGSCTTISRIDLVGPKDS